MVSESNSRITLPPNWLKLMNTSVEDLPFEVKLDKANIGLDPATIKFLPLILKTLKKNKYFDKNEDTSQNPIHDRKESTDYNIFDKNIFSDTRNWMKIPSSRFYTIEYKTSPIVYFKNPTRNIDYFKKVRKIRDYQRIMNFVDKMINERVTFGSTIPMHKNIYNLHKSSITTDYTTPMTKTNEYEPTTQNEHTEKPKIKSSKEKARCSCPKKMNELLSKLISSLQKLLPNFTNLPDQSSPVAKSFVYENSKSKSEILQTITFKPQLELSTKSYTFITPNITETTKPHRTQHTTITLPKIDYTLNAIIALLKPNVLKKNRKYKNLLSLKTTTTKNYIEGTDRNYKLENTTETMKNISATGVYNSATTVKDYILNSNSKQIAKSFFTDPKEYEEYLEATTGAVNNRKILDTRNLELVNREIVANTKTQEANEIEDKSMFSYNNPYTENYNLLNKMTELDFSTTIVTTDNLDITWESSEKPKTIEKEAFMTSTFSNTKMGFKNKSLSNQVVTDNHKIELTLKSKDITLEDEIEKTSPEDITAEENLNNLENIIKNLNTSDIYNETTTEDSDLHEWELIKIEDNSDKNDIFAKSMIPEERASYLEIQRNDWKQDEHQDYDNNINHYLFE